MSSSVSSSYVGGSGDNPPPQAQSKAKKDQLRQALMPSFEKLYRLIPESLPFRQPVDPQALGIPNYFNIVKKPIDLSTIKRKLDAGEYKAPLEYCHDVWLMFDNAWLFNKKTSRVYKHCTTLSEVFAEIIQPVVESHSYRHGFDLDDGSSQEARKLSIQRCIQSLLHACQCRDANCCLPSCDKMKRVIKHTKLCKSRTNGGCPICKQLIALCCYHAKHCQETKCLVPFCSNIKHKLKQQHLQQRLQQAQLLRRRNAAMNGSQTGAQVNAIQGSQQTSTTPIQQQQQQPPSPPQAQQQSLPQSLPQSQPSIPMSSGGVGIGIVGVGGVGVGGGPGVGPPNANVNIQSKQSLQQLLQVLRSPSTPEQHSQILQILKSNPPLMAAFIKQRQQQSGQQHAEAVNQMGPSQQQQQQPPPPPQAQQQQLQQAQLLRTIGAMNGCQWMFKLMQYKREQSSHKEFDTTGPKDG